jgi:hypothetical protein
MTDTVTPSPELHQTQLALQLVSELHQMKSGFLAQTSHELRSPLSSLMSLLQLILNDLCEDPQEERDFLHQAYGAAQRLMEMIDELVKVSKMTTGAIALQYSPVEMNILLEEVYALTHLQAANRNIALTLEKSDRPFAYLADEGQLLAVLVMLLDSVIRHQEGGHITLSLQRGLTVRMPFSDRWEHPLPPPPLPEPLTLATLEQWSQQVHLSAGMQWQLAQSLMVCMGGNLSHQAISQEDTTESQWQFQLPIAPLG